MKKMDRMDKYILIKYTFTIHQLHAIQYTKQMTDSCKTINGNLLIKDVRAAGEHLNNPYIEVNKAYKTSMTTCFVQW